MCMCVDDFGCEWDVPDDHGGDGDDNDHDCMVPE